MNAHIRPRRGAALGVLAALLGYLLTYGLRLSEIQTATSEGGRYAADGLGPAGWNVAGWLWAAAHHVPVQAIRDTMWGGYEMGVGPTAGDPWSPILFALPVVLLVVAGAFTTDPTRSRRTASKQGATVVFGYAPMAVLSLYLFRWGAKLPADWRTQTIGVFLDPVAVVVVMALAFPLLFGAIGGRLRHELGR